MIRFKLLFALAAASLLPFETGRSQPMEQRISVITLGVKDLAASRRFYVDGLGWRPVYQDNEILFFQTGGIVFALFLHDKLAADFHADPTSLGRAPMSLGYNVRTKPEVDRLMEQAAGAGAKILKPAHETAWGGYSGYFADPDDFAWEIAWNPSWTISPDGSVQFH